MEFCLVIVDLDFFIAGVTEEPGERDGKVVRNEEDSLAVILFSVFLLPDY
jgi:hypothetical protein